MLRSYAEKRLDLYCFGNAIYTVIRGLGPDLQNLETNWHAVMINKSLRKVYHKSNRTLSWAELYINNF